MAKTTGGPVEHVADLTCPNSHTVEVHWTEGQQAPVWQCPRCNELGAEVATARYDGHRSREQLAADLVQAHTDSLVRFGNRKRGDRELPHDLAARG